MLRMYYRHHVFVKNAAKQVQLAEVGPRFEMKRTYVTFYIAFNC